MIFTYILLRARPIIWPRTRSIQLLIQLPPPDACLSHSFAHSIGWLLTQVGELYDGVPSYRRSECTTQEAEVFLLQPRQTQPHSTRPRQQISSAHQLKCVSSMALLRYRVPAGPRYWYIVNTTSSGGNLDSGLVTLIHYWPT
eukprot:COSAG05_NODE_519_length_9047_cov_25.276263_5_plen_142_part_00